jgi:hypothetical protein
MRRPGDDPRGKPVSAVPGLMPRSPLTTDKPVLVTACPAKIAKVVVVPRGTVLCADVVGV